MKLVSFRAGDVSRYGVVTMAGVVDLTRHLRYPDLKALLAAGALPEAEHQARTSAVDYTLDQIAYEPVIPNPGKILCIGLNYEAHREETRFAKKGHPTVFTRFADTQVGHLAGLVMPRNSEQFDYEGELAVVIGTGGRDIGEDHALHHVAGYSCYNDASVRDYQFHTTQFTAGKNFPATGALGPFLVTRDEVGPLEGKIIRTRLSGKVVQDATLGMMIFPIPRLIAYVSRFTALAPGDLIVSGTPGGIGMERKPPLWMKVGDTVEVEIENVGLLKNTIVPER